MVFDTDIHRPAWLVVRRCGDLVWSRSLSIEHGQVVMTNYSIRESRLRHDCERHGWRLMKSRRSEESDSGSGGFMIVESLTGAVLAGGSPHAFSMTLDEVKDYLAARHKRTRR